MASIEDLILADVATLRRWAENEKAMLNFTGLRDIYSKYFSNGTAIHMNPVVRATADEELRSHGNNSVKLLTIRIFCYKL